MVEPTDEAIDEAVRCLRAGAPVAFPTETVYGLGAGTFDPGALERAYELKGRPLNNPLIAHVADAHSARRVVAHWDDRCDALIERYWPGPLALVLPKDESVPARATAGLDTIAVRCPRHRVALRLLEAFGDPISAPSANRSGGISPTAAQHVADDFPDAEDLMILDGGRCDLGLESTVLDMTGPRPRILRPGAVSEPELAALLGDVDAPFIDTQAASPGTSPRHYAPSKPAELVEPHELGDVLFALAKSAAVLCFDASAVGSPHVPIEMPQGAGTYAQHLYEALRQADAADVQCIIIEAPPMTNELWKAVRDRLIRATA